MSRWPAALPEAVRSSMQSAVEPGLSCAATAIPPPAAEAVLRLLARGAASRHTAATRVNDTSSRSHMVGQG